MSEKYPASYKAYLKFAGEEDETEKDDTCQHCGVSFYDLSTGCPECLPIEVRKGFLEHASEE